MEISTVKLQEMVLKAMKGVGNNKLLPVTSLINIRIDAGDLVLVTTDGVNYLYIQDSIESNEEFYVTVEADKFSKLISKMTCDKIYLELKDTYLEVIGNGVYKIELPLGSVVQYPDPLNNLSNLGNFGTVNASVINDILNYIKPSLAVTNEIPCYTGYYVADKVIATDTNKIACLNVPVFEEPRLISSEMMNMLSVMSPDDLIDVYADDTKIAFVTDEVAVYGESMNYLQDFQIDAINKLLESKFASKCTLSKNALLQSLDRLSLFVGVYDENAVHLEFTDEELCIFSKNSDAYEDIEYASYADNNAKDFECDIDIQMFQTQVKTQSSGDDVTIWFGEKNSILLRDSDVVKMVALMA